MNSINALLGGCGVLFILQNDTTSDTKTFDTIYFTSSNFYEKLWSIEYQRGNVTRMKGQFTRQQKWGTKSIRGNAKQQRYTLSRSTKMYSGDFNWQLNVVLSSSFYLCHVCIDFQTAYERKID